MNIYEYFTSLGTTSDEIAESLRRQGIKGVRMSPCHCPILNGLYKAVPDYWAGLKIYGGNSSDGNRFAYGASLGDPQIFDPALPKAVQNFIGDFDLGKYPDLEVKSVKEVTTRVW